MHLTTYLHLLIRAEDVLGGDYQTVSEAHRADADVHYACLTFATDCRGRAAALRPVLDRYSDAREPEPERLHPLAMESARSGAIGLLRDLQDLDQLATLVQSTCTLVGQAAQGARDRELIELASDGDREANAQLGWLRARMRATAAQTLLAKADYS